MPDEFRLDDSFDSNGLQYIWSAHSIGLAETCLRKYQLTKVLRWRSKHPSFHLVFGGLYAEALERYHRLKIEGADTDTAMKEVVRQALIASWHHDLDEAGNRIPGTGQPWDSQNTKKNRESLIRSIIWYILHYEDDPVHVITLSNGEPAVELEGKFEIDDGLMLTWRIDQLVEYSEDIYVQDQKTTGYDLSPHYFAQYNPDTQMSLLTFIGRAVYDTPVKGVIIDAAKVMVGTL